MKGFKSYDDLPPGDDDLAYRGFADFWYQAHPLHGPWFGIQLKGFLIQSAGWTVRCTITHFGHVGSIITHWIGRGSGYETKDDAIAAAKQWCESELDAVDWGVMPNGLGNSVKALCRTWGIY